MASYLLQILCGPVVLAEQITESRPVPEGLRRLQELAQLRCGDGAQHLREENRSEVCGERERAREGALRYLRPSAHRDQRLEAVQVRKSEMKEGSLEELIETPVAIAAKGIRICRGKTSLTAASSTWIIKYMH